MSANAEYFVNCSKFWLLLTKRIDKYLFIKNYYSLFKHLIPFLIGSLLVIVLSLPSENDNLIFKLVKLLKEPSWIWGPAMVLSIIATSVYYYTIKAQVRQAYLLQGGDKRRSRNTGIAYILFCTVLAASVLFGQIHTGMSYKEIIAFLWASYLVTVLSFIGIGLDKPDSLVEAMGIKSPDYTDGRHAAEEMANILICVRSNEHTNCPDKFKNLKDFRTASDDLKTCIKKNLNMLNRAINLPER